MENNSNQITLKDLAVEHPYYCNLENYSDAESKEQFETWEDFWSEYQDADRDMNLCFRFDINEHDGNYDMNIFFIQQRRGNFFPVQILSIKELNIDQILEFLNRLWDKMQSLWKPLK